MIELNPAELRVLGSLAEKELTTPDYYPLTLNALVNACNQKSSRDPVVTYTASEVMEVINNLINKELVLRYHKSENRVPKFKHRLREFLQVNDAHLSLLTVLMLRGPQTPGELKSRTYRMYEFDDLAEVGERLQQLSSKAEHQYVQLLPRVPGQKEARYMHLLGGEIEPGEYDAGKNNLTSGIGFEQRLSDLEQALDSLKNDLANLRQAFAQFKSQFD